MLSCLQYVHVLRPCRHQMRQAVEQLGPATECLPLMSTIALECLLQHINQHINVYQCTFGDHCTSVFTSALPCLLLHFSVHLCTAMSITAL